MIEFNYVLTRDEKDEIRTYVPEGIPTQLPDIVYIEGPNSTGKSTLLNVVALAFHGLKSEKITPQLKSKLRTLSESDHQNIKFEVKITNGKNGLLLTSEKNSGDSPEITVKEVVNGKTSSLSSDLFARKYNLLYDIPDNPTTRLTLLVNELRDMQNKYATETARLSALVRSTIKEVKDARDPERIAELEANQKKLEDEIKQKEEELRISSELHSEREQFWLARTLAYHSDEVLKLKATVDNLEGRRDKARKTARRVETKLNKQWTEAESSIEDMRDCQRRISGIMGLLLRGDDRDILGTWDQIDLDIALKNFEFPTSVSRTLRGFRGALEKLVSGSSRRTMSESKILTDLIDTLGRYRDSDIVIPGLDKTVEDFIEILQNRRREYESVETLVDNVQKAYKEIEAFETKKKDLERVLVELSRSKPKDSSEANGDGEDFDQVGSRLDTQIAKQKDAEDRYKKTLVLCAKRDITENDLGRILAAAEHSDSLAPYLAYDERQLEKAIESAAGDLQAMETKIKRLKTQRTIDGKEYVRLKRAEPHKYQDQLEHLDRIKTKCQFLEQRFARTYKNYLAVLAGGSASLTGNPEETRYFEAVASFLGKKLGTIRHVDREHRVASVDLRTKELVTDGGKVVHLDDMGTGQSQSAYIVSLLNVQDNRKIIAMFDEVAMMDANSLGRVYSKLNELYGTGKLLAGIVVQRGDVMKVESRVGIGD